MPREKHPDRDIETQGPDGTDVRKVRVRISKVGDSRGSRHRERDTKTRRPALEALAISVDVPVAHLPMTGLKR